MVGVPTKNTLDRVTSMLPKLLYQRLDEIGLDFAALSDRGAAHPFIADEETREATC
jgi:hypothetical protein